MRQSTRKLMSVCAGILTVIGIVVMYLTHREVPFMMDDIWYSTILSDESVPITSLGDIVKAQIWHYQNWGGRSMTHSILQLILLAGEQVADILNIVFTLLLGGMICVVSENRSLPAFFAAVGMTLGLNANWRMSMFWQSGAANYLYITVFILGFAFVYLREVEGQSKGLPGIVFWIVPLGILTGWSNENMGPALWVMSLLVIALVYKESKKLKLWMVLGNLSCLVGSVLCIIAPGNFVRTDEVASEEYGILWRIFLRCYAEGKAALEYLFPTLLVLAGMVFVAKCVLQLEIGKRNGLLLVTALLSWGAFILSPHYPDRATFGTMVLCICVILSLAGKIKNKRSDLAPALFGISILIWLRGMYFCGEWLAICWGWIK